MTEGAQLWASSNVWLCIVGVGPGGGKGGGVSWYIVTGRMGP